MAWNDDNMTPKEKEFWRGIGQEIKSARKAHTKHGLNDDRRKRKISQYDLAEAVGLSRPSIANIECGRQAINLYMHKKIMEFLANGK